MASASRGVLVSFWRLGACLDACEWEGWRGRSGLSCSSELVTPFSLQSTELWWKWLLSTGLSTSLFWQLRQHCWKTPGISKHTHQHTHTRYICSPALLFWFPQVKSSIGILASLHGRKISFTRSEPCSLCLKHPNVARPVTHWAHCWLHAEP